jgi:hypothetical protein
MSTDQQLETREACSLEVARAGMHICYIYNDEKERSVVIGRFLEAGARAREQRVGVGDPASMRAQLVSGGIRPGEEPEWVFFDPGTLSSKGTAFAFDEVFRNFRAFYELALKQGFSGVRCVGDMTWLEHVRWVEDTPLEFEAAVNYLLKTHPYASICYYDARTVDGNMLFDALRVHPYLVVGTEIVRNPYYIEPSVFLEKRRARAPAPGQ